MPEIHYIKHLRENSMNFKYIGDFKEKVGRNWRTVKKYADGDVLSFDFDNKFTKTGMMYDKWIWENCKNLWLEEG